jgi:hypothetical protein
VGTVDSQDYEQDEVIPVSIQLVSPASGDIPESLGDYDEIVACFHSISFPSEWGLVGFVEHK